jgi:hypothetical protein
LLASAEDAPGWSRGKLPVLKNLVSAHEGRLNYSREFASSVGSELVPVMEAVGFDAKLCIGIEDHEVSVAAHRNGSLSLLQARETRGAFAHPSNNMRESIAARTCFRPHGREAEL